MRRFAALTSVLMLGAVAACTGSSGAADDEGGGTPAPPTAYDERTVPYELAITAPEGYTLIEDEERDVPVVEDQATWVYGLDGGDANTRLIVSTYVLPEGTDLADFAAQSAYVLEYDAKTGNEVDASNIYPTVVHRYSGVHRYFTSQTDDDAKLFRRHFFMFAGSHLIQITCQWQRDQDALVAGCYDLTENFPYPEGWPLYDESA